jgi:hypothetical protein
MNLSYEQIIRDACIGEIPEISSSGRAIRLTDIMVVLRSKNTHFRYAIDQDGLFIKIVPNHEYGWDPYGGMGRPAVWNIYKDDLSLQSEECKSFIALLLR